MQSRKALHDKDMKLMETIIKNCKGRKGEKLYFKASVTIFNH